MEPDTPNGSSGEDSAEKKPLRLRLGRNKEDSAQSESTPEDSSEEEEQPSQIPEKKGGDDVPAESTRSEKPFRLSLKRSSGQDPESESESKSSDASAEEYDGMEPEESPFGDDDFDDFEGPDIESSFTHEEEKAPPGDAGEPTPEAQSTPPQPPPKTTPPTRIRLRPKSDQEQEKPAGTPVPASPAQDTTDTGKQEDKDQEGWEGTPESQLNAPATPQKQNTGEEKVSETKSGLKLRTREPSEQDKAPEGMSHGTLTPFERDKAVLEDKGDSFTPKKAKKGAEKKGHPGKWIILVALLVILALLGTGAAMIMGLGPFATPPPESPLPPRIEKSSPGNTVEEENIEAPSRDANEMMGSTPAPEQASPGEPAPVEMGNNSGATGEIAEEDQVVIRIPADESREKMPVEESEPTQVITEAQPLEDLEPAPPSRNPDITSFIDNMNISGANESRQVIIFNNTPYERNQYVDFNLGIQFHGIKGRYIYFKDSNGAIYNKEF